MVPLSRTESLSVETVGRGDPVVIIPGLFGSVYGFRTLVPLLVDAGYRAIVIEPLGIGSSARPEKANYSLTAQADRIAAVLDSLHVRAALLIAHSIGGAEGFRLAYRRPDLVRGLLSIGGGPAETATPAACKRGRRFAPWINPVGGVRHDGDVSATEVQLLERSLHSFAIDSVPGAGHFIYEEQAGAVVAALARLKASVTPARTSGSE